MKTSKTFVIAEAGVNHDGDIDLALALVDAAAAAGADAVKFQTFDADALASVDALKAEYQRDDERPLETQREMLKRLQLDLTDYQHLVERCAVHGIEFMSTGFETDSVDFLVALGLRRIKIPSGEITNLPYLRHVGRMGLPLLLSTGMADLSEVRTALEALQQSGADLRDISVLHCVTSYPVPFEDANLLAIKTIRDTFGVRVGYSDHTLGIEAAVAAVALGASIVEKHLTLDRSAAGPDHSASLEPLEFKLLVGAIRNVERALGDGRKQPRPSERPNIAVARRSLVAAQTIHTGEVFSPQNVTAKRPGTGVSPVLWDRIIGNRAQRDYAADEQLDFP